MAMIWGFHPADLVILGAFFIGLLIIGYRSSKRIHNQEDFFLGGRRFGKLITTFTNFGQATSDEHAVWMTSVVMKNGAAGITFAIGKGLLVMPIYWFTNRWWRRLRMLSLADFFVERYNSRRMAAAFVVVGVTYFMLLVGLGLNALTHTVAAVAAKPESELTAAEQVEYTQAQELERLESADLDTLTRAEQQRLTQLREQKPRMVFPYINRNWLLFGVVLFVILYSCAGGLEAAAFSDLLQGIGIIFLSVALIPFAMLRINSEMGTTGLLGPFRALHQTVPEGFMRVFGSASIPEFTWYFLLSFAVMGIVNGLAQPNAMVSMGAAKDEKTARVGGVTGNFIKRYCTVAWGFIALLALVLYRGQLQNPDLVWGRLVRDLLGPLGIGLVGLMVASMLGALMSTADTLMLTSSGLLSNNIYKPLVQGRSEHHYIQAGRVFNVLFLVGALMVASYFQSLLSMIKFILIFNAVVGAPFLLGMLWRRATRHGAWACIGIMLFYNLILPIGLPMLPGIRESEALMKKTAPSPIKQEHIASRMDIERRAGQIIAWEDAAARGEAQGEKPEPIELGQPFTKTFQPEARSIFWGGGIKTDEQGRRTGQGLLKVDLVLLDRLGWDLSRNPYALNESLTAILRIIVPFGAVILVSLVTRRDDKRLLDRFFAKMHTPVTGDKEHDERELALNLKNPERADTARLFPNSDWEFARWDAYDVKGLGWIAVGVGGCVGLIWLIVNLGA